MKKILFVAILAMASVMVYAQPRAIGARLGAFDGISYQHTIGAGMLEVEAGWSVDARTDFFENTPAGQVHTRAWGQTVQAAVTYDWIDPFSATVPWNEKGEWHWYMGVGAAGGYGWNAWGDFNAATVGGRYDWGFIGAAGRIGIEYDFWFPLQLSLDWRPTLGASLFDNLNNGVKSGLYWEMTGIALGVRYKF